MHIMRCATFISVKAEKYLQIWISWVNNSSVKWREMELNQKTATTHLGPVTPLQFSSLVGVYEGFNHLWTAEFIQHTEGNKILQADWKANWS